MHKNKILILEGGFNEEHEVSLATAKEIKKSLFNQNIEFKSLLVSPKNFEEQISKFSNEYICINALHGPYGEDGQIQKILENLSFKFSHSSSKASRLGFNKELSKECLKSTKVLMLDHEVVESRLCGWWAHNMEIDCLRVWISVSDEERARRIQTREGGSFEERLLESRQRQEDDNQRYLELYEIDMEDMSPYNLIIEADNLDANEVFSIVSEELGG